MKFKEYLIEAYNYEGYFKLDNSWIKERFKTSAKSEQEALRNFMFQLSKKYNINIKKLTRMFSQTGNKWEPEKEQDYVIRKI